MLRRVRWPVSLVPLSLPLLVVWPTVMRAQQNAQEAPVIEAPEDMACVEGARAKHWQAVKEGMRQLFNQSSDAFAAAGDEDLAKAVEAAIQEVQLAGGWAKEAADECGYGKLFLQLLTLARMSEPAVLAQYLQEHPSMSSPVLTLLLDIPWVVTAQTGWPFFAILRQINHQKVQVVGPMLRYEEIDGLKDADVNGYFDTLAEAHAKTDFVSALQASNTFLTARHAAAPGNPFAVLTALASQAAVQLNVQERVDMLRYVQESMRATISNPAELDVALTTRWPLWSYLHVALDVFSDV